MENLRLTSKVMRLTTATLSLCLTTCLQKTSEKLDEKISLRPVISDASELGNKTTELIESVSGLTETQRNLLTQIKNKSEMEIKFLNESSLKLRSLLYEDLFAKKFDRREVELLKGRIRSVEKKKVDLMLIAVERAATILGKGTSASKKRLDELYFNLGRDFKTYPR